MPGPGARSEAIVPFTASDGTAFSGEDMTGPAVTNAFDVRGWDYIAVIPTVTSATTSDVTITCDVGYGSETTAAHPVVSEDLVAGVATQKAYSPTTLAADITASPQALGAAVFPVLGARLAQVTVTGTAGTVDLVIVGRNS